MSFSPYFTGYLRAAAYGTKRQFGVIVGMPPKVYPEGSRAQAAYLEGMADSSQDREPRRPHDPHHRVSRAYPPWRLI